MGIWEKLLAWKTGTNIENLKEEIDYVGSRKIHKKQKYDSLSQNSFQGEKKNMYERYEHIIWMQS